MARRKPRGHTSYITLGSDVRFQTVTLPASKEEIERWIVDRAQAAAALDPDPGPFQKVAPVRNPEDHFDFTLPTASGDEYLDLMELVILPEGARGYEDGRPLYDAEMMAEAVFSKIAAKSLHYGASRSAIHLLLYDTDWRFRLVQPVVEHLTVMLGRRRHIFRTVCFFAPDDEEHGEFIRLYPVTPAEFDTYARRHDEAKQRGRRTVGVADPRASTELPEVRKSFPRFDKFCPKIRSPLSHRLCYRGDRSEHRSGQGGAGDGGNGRHGRTPEPSTKIQLPSPKLSIAA